ncbi:hypothetical protein [Nocardia aurantiaca]|uniref:hypothetical protein n=1 Tax=Nocardia aurantiaca TaxID=2675850 RepID=UPI001E56A302|nr:hypothetical protein [Nocardia aurantiaca]
MIAADHAMPQLYGRIGCVSPRRLLQAHIDYVIMGVILIAVGTAVPDLATWAATLVLTGTLLNPTLFLPLAFHEKLTDNLGYRIVSVISFLATSVGLVSAALSYQPPWAPAIRPSAFQRGRPPDHAGANKHAGSNSVLSRSGRVANSAETFVEEDLFAVERGERIVSGVGILVSVDTRP